MNDESNSHNENELTQDEVLTKAKQLLKLTDLVERYPAVVERRVTGLIFVLIGGGVSLATLLFYSLIEYVFIPGYELLSVVIFVIASLSVSFLISFKLVRPLTRSYTRTSQREEELSGPMKILWSAISIIMVISSIYSFGTGQPYLFPIIVQIVLALGNLFIYYGLRTDPKSADYAGSHLVLVIFVILSIVPIILVPQIALSIMILVDIGGLYALGIYILSTAERMLVQTMGSD